MKKKTYKIIKRNGELDLEVKDGVYHLDAKITIEDGEMKYIDDGIFTPFNGSTKQ